MKKTFKRICGWCYKEFTCLKTCKTHSQTSIFCVCKECVDKSINKTQFVDTDKLYCSVVSNEVKEKIKTCICLLSLRSNRSHVKFERYIPNCYTNNLETWWLNSEHTT